MEQHPTASREKCSWLHNATETGIPGFDEGKVENIVGTVGNGRGATFIRVAERKLHN
jgi:hypothetical protein